MYSVMRTPSPAPTASEPKMWISRSRATPPTDAPSVAPNALFASELTAANAKTIARSARTTTPRIVSLIGPSAPVSFRSASTTVGESAANTTPIVSETTPR